LKGRELVTLIWTLIVFPTLRLPVGQLDVVRLKDPQAELHSPTTGRVAPWAGRISPGSPLKRPPTISIASKGMGLRLIMVESGTNSIAHEIKFLDHMSLEREK
jgi:hypothetical protein